MDNTNKVYVIRNKEDNSEEIILKLFSIYVELRLEEDRNKKTEP